MAVELEQVGNFCDAILQLREITACVIFDPDGRRAILRVKGDMKDNFLSKYGEVIGGVIIGGLRAAEPLAGRLRSVACTFEEFAVVSLFTDSGFAAVVTTLPKSDPSKVLRLMEKELRRTGLPMN